MSKAEDLHPNVSTTTEPPAATQRKAARRKPASRRTRLLLAVPVPLAAAHQAGAVLVVEVFGRNARGPLVQATRDVVGGAGQRHG